MGSGSSRSGSRQDPNGASRPGGGVSSSNPNPNLKKTGWEWFEISFGTMDLADDSDEDGDVGDDAPTAESFPEAPAPMTAGEGGGGAATTADPGVTEAGAGGTGGGGGDAPPAQPEGDPAQPSSGETAGDSAPAAVETAPNTEPASAPAPTPAPAKPAAPDLSNLPSLSVTGVKLYVSIVNHLKI